MGRNMAIRAPMRRRLEMATKQKRLIALWKYHCTIPFGNKTLLITKVLHLSLQALTVCLECSCSSVSSSAFGAFQSRPTLYPRLTLMNPHIPNNLQAMLQTADIKVHLPALSCSRQNPFQVPNRSHFVNSSKTGGKPARNGRCGVPHSATSLHLQVD